MTDINSLTESMDRAARFFDKDYEEYRDDLPVLEAYAARTAGPLLELGCGTGRALVHLAEAGYAVTGVDLSAEMLCRARARAESAEVSDRITLVQGDFSLAPLEGPFRFAYVVMNTFLHLPDQAAQLAALRHWRSHLAPRGLLLIDVFHPDVGQLAAIDGRLEWDKTWQDPLTGATVMKFVTRTADLGEQKLRVNLIYDETQPSGQVSRTVVPFELRYLWRFEAELLLEKAGYTVEAMYGDWDMGPFEGSSERMIFIARRKG